MEQHTNPTRHLDRLGVPYRVHEYAGGALSGMAVAEATGEDPREVFKTLVTASKDGRHYVFLVPVTGSLDLKKAAASVGEKSLSMIRSDELLPLTGYVHGGCSPLCLKRPMRITVDASAEGLERIYFSAGRVGMQIEMAVADLGRAMEFGFADVAKPPERARRAPVRRTDRIRCCIRAPTRIACDCGRRIRMCFSLHIHNSYNLSFSEFVLTIY